MPDVQIRNHKEYPLHISRSKEGRIDRAIVLIPKGVSFGEEFPPGVTPIDDKIWKELKADVRIARRLKNGDLSVIEASK